VPGTAGVDYSVVSGGIGQEVTYFAVVDCRSKKQ
jgi:hypothetical protein